MPFQANTLGRELSLHGIDRLARRSLLTWVRTGALLTAAGYSIVSAVTFLRPEAPFPWQELAVATIGWTGVWLVGRGYVRPAAVIVILAVWCELHLSIMQGGSLRGYVGVAALPVLVIAVGLLVGGRAAIWMALASSITPLLAAVAGRGLMHPTTAGTFHDDWFAAVIVALSQVCAAVLVAQGLRMFGRVLESALDIERRSSQLGEILEQAASEIYIVGADPLQFLMVSRGARDNLGYGSGEIVSLEPHVVSPALTAGLYDVLTQNGANPAARAVSTRRTVHRRKDGSAYPVEMHVQAGELAGRSILIVFAVDITDRVRAEEESTALHERLQQAQKLDAVGLLAGGVAHDFNNLLTVIGGSAELIELTGSPDVGALAREIGKAHEKGALLTRKLLAFARQEVVQSTILSVSETVAEARSLVGTLLGESIRLEVESSGDGAIVADPGQIEQVLLNLAANARDSMPDGGVVTIESDVGVTRPGFARIAVRDQGTGMDAETLRRVFEPFFTTKPRAKGTGLGLSTVHGIVSQNEGAVEIESEPGVGTVVSVYWPLHRHAAPATGADGRATRSTEMPEGGSILVVEDNEATRRVVRLLLESAGYQVLTAEHGEAAIDVLGAGERIDLMLTDVVMPGMSGIDLAERVAADRPDLPILLMSGYMEDQVARDGKVVAGERLIQKPFRGSELVTRVRAALKGAAAA